MLNSVTISIQDYNEFRDFRKEIGKGNTSQIFYSYNSNWYNDTYISINDTVKRIAENNAKLVE